MDLKAIKVFVLAAKTLNFSQVAENLFLSPSSVSKYIAQLESDVGHPLFSRDTRNVELSEYGRALLPYAEEVWLRGQELDRFISQLSDSKCIQTIIFGLNRDIQLNPMRLHALWLLTAFSSFREEHPSTCLTLRFQPEPVLIKAVIANTIQIAVVWDRHFINSPALEKHLSYFVIPNEQRYVVFSPQQYPDAACIDDLTTAGGKVIYTALMQSGTSAASLAQHYFPYSSLQPCNSWCEEFVRVISEEGVGFVDHTLVDMARAVGLRYFPLDYPEQDWNICLIWNKAQKDHAVLRFAEHMKTHFPTDLL